MKTLFADTFYFLALLNRADRQHARAKLYSAGLGVKIVTTAWVLTELGDAMCSVRSRSGFSTVLDVISTDLDIEICPADEATWQAGVTLYRARPDKEWSLTDCISFAVMQQRNLSEALTGDHHFEQAGFAAVLK